MRRDGKHEIEFLCGVVVVLEGSWPGYSARAEHGFIYVTTRWKQWPVHDVSFITKKTTTKNK